jgi:hypothetical protein
VQATPMFVNVLQGAPPQRLDADLPAERDLPFGNHRAVHLFLQG